MLIHWLEGISINIIAILRRKVKTKGWKEILEYWKCFRFIVIWSGALYKCGQGLGYLKIATAVNGWSFLSVLISSLHHLHCFIGHDKLILFLSKRSCFHTCFSACTLVHQCTYIVCGPTTPLFRKWLGIREKLFKDGLL